MTMHPETEERPAKYRKWVTKKANLLEEIENYEHQLEKLKAELKDTAKHITWGQLDEKLTTPVRICASSTNSGDMLALLVPNVSLEFPGGKVS
jgi:hypothetical protein